MQLRSSLSDNQPWKNAPKPPPHTLTHTSVYLHTGNMRNQLTGVCVCVCVSAYKPNLHCLIAEHIVPSLVNANLICREADILYRETTKHSHRYTHPASIPALTVTDPLADKTPHPSGRAWYWGPPSSPSRTPRHIHTPHTHFIEGGYSCTHKHLTSLSENPSTHTSAGIFFHSLSPSSLTRSLPPSLSISPPSLSSLTANQTGGDIIVLQPVQRQDYECVCVMGEKRGERDTHKDTPGILTGLCPCQTS